MPSNKCIIEKNWVFKNKRDIQFRERLFVQGYTQVTGVDFTNNYSPLVTDITLCVILLMWLLNKCYSHNIDIETQNFIRRIIRININEDIRRNGKNARRTIYVRRSTVLRQAFGDGDLIYITWAGPHHISKQVN